MRITAELFDRILYGSAFLGSGGGGMIMAGQKFIGEILKNVDHVDLLTFPLSDDAKKVVGCIVCDIGSITQLDPEQSAALKFAFDHLSDNYKSKHDDQIKAVFPIETGPENTLAPFVLASKYDIPVVDGDGAARAVPTLPLSTFSVEGVKNPQPVAISNGRGEIMLVSNNTKGKGIDSLLRGVAGLKNYSNSASLALWPGKLKELSEKCISGTITNALHCGQLLEGLRTNNDSLVEASLPVVNKLEGYLIGMGPVIYKTGYEEGAFNFTTTRIRNKFLDNIITVISQNESLIAFDNTSYSPVAMAPDSICYLKSDFHPCTNAEIKSVSEEDTKDRQRVFLIAVKAHEKLKHREIKEGFIKIIKELGYAGNMDITTPEPKPLGDLFIDLKKDHDDFIDI